MPSIINENFTFQDTDGLPIVNGFIHIGERNQDPTLLANKITIYSDRDLTTTLANPQRTDSYGKSNNKIFVPGKYSITVTDSDAVQEYTDLDAGELPSTGVTQLENVQGTNTVIADAVPTITALVDNQTYVFRAAGANTGAMTLQIDTTAQKSILKQHDVAMVSGDVEANQTIMVVYNATDDVFELVSNITTANVTDLVVSNTATVGGKDVDTKEAAVTNHIRAGNTQIWSAATDETTIDITTNVTVSTWETVGATGSGATNIWTALDNLPATAKILIATVEIELQEDVDGNDCTLKVFAVDGDIASPIGTFSNQIGELRIFDTTVDAGLTLIGGQRQVLIPLGPTNQDFKIRWTQTNGTGASIDLIYNGFITD